MDELELLKKDWKKQEGNLPKLSYDEIYRMILKRSSSIVKWIFIISMLEFVLLASLELVGRLTGSTQKNWEQLGIGEGANTLLSILSFGILIYFITRFYLNYKRIRSTDSAKVLMENILRTRRTVKYYVYINLSFLTLMMFFVLGYLFLHDPAFTEMQNAENAIPKWAIVILLCIFVAIIVVVVGFVYYLLYGLLTRKLKRNYKELERLEV